jgi:HK97 family phage prohead protease
MFCALAATFGVDPTGDRFVPGSFALAINSWQGKALPLRWSHGETIGRVDGSTMRETDEGLEVFGRLDLEHSEAARRAWRLVQAGDIGLSIKFCPVDHWRWIDGTREVRTLGLRDISLTPNPAQLGTKVLAVGAGQ